MLIKIKDDYDNIVWLNPKMIVSIDIEPRSDSEEDISMTVMFKANEESTYERQLEFKTMRKIDNIIKDINKELDKNKFSQSI